MAEHIIEIEHPYAGPAKERAFHVEMAGDLENGHVVASSFSPDGHHSLTFFDRAGRRVASFNATHVIRVVRVHPAPPADPSDYNIPPRPPHPDAPPPPPPMAPWGGPRFSKADRT